MKLSDLYIATYPSGNVYLLAKLEESMYKVLHCIDVETGHRQGAIIHTIDNTAIKFIPVTSEEQLGDILLKII